MKKIFTLCLMAFMLHTASAIIVNDTITLDLTQPTNPTVFNYESNGAWEFTYDESGDYLYFESQGMNFYHLPSLESYSGSSYEGFTVSNSSDNSLNYESDLNHQFNCMAQGGVDSSGAPYLVGYYSEYYAMMNGESPLQIIFDTVVTPISFYEIGRAHV